MAVKYSLSWPAAYPSSASWSSAMEPRIGSAVVAMEIEATEVAAPGDQEQQAERAVDQDVADAHHILL
jgi:hypothetical protein